MVRSRTGLAPILTLLLACTACGMLRRTSSGEAPLDLNTAPVRRIEKLPGITPSMARRIVEGRPYGAPSELVTRGILTQRELERIMDEVEVKDAR